MGSYVICFEAHSVDFSTTFTFWMVGFILSQMVIIYTLWKKKKEEEIDEEEEM